jgi:ERCC4-type nuclease
MPSFYVAPSEPIELKGLGKSSALPERYGVDILIPSRLGAIGVQRKELSDFFASVTDGRLAREYPMMQGLAVAVLLIEGRQRWSTEGYYLGSDRSASYSRQAWTRDQFRSYMLSVQSKGIWVVETDDLTDTRKWLENMARWANKEAHRGLAGRPKPQGAWGKADSRDWLLFLAQSFPGIGAAQAEKMVDHFGGTLPIAWTCTPEELLACPGIGKGRMESLLAALPKPEEF